MMLRMVVLWDLIAVFGTQSEQGLILEIILAARGFLCLDESVVVDRTAWKSAAKLRQRRRTDSDGGRQLSVSKKK